MKADRTAAAYTLIKTCKFDILARMPDHPLKQIDELLPWTWNKARQLALAAVA
jgi:hypothetical protein